MPSLNKKTFSKVAVAATMAFTILSTSMVTAEAGKKQRNRNIGLGIVGALVGAAIINEGSRRRHYNDSYHSRDCWWEKRRRWSNYHDRYVYRKIKVCD